MSCDEEKVERSGAKRESAPAAQEGEGVEGALGEESGGEERFALIFSALGESTRLRIMQMLPRQPICEQMYNVIELAEELGLTQPTVSHHLKILAEAGLVLSRRKCNSVYFYVNQPVVLEWLKLTKKRFGCESCSL